MCGLPCKSGSCRATTCPSCEQGLSPFTSTFVVYNGKRIGVSTCHCVEGQLFAIWALSCGWEALPKPSEPKHSCSTMVNKLRSHFKRTAKDPPADPQIGRHDSPFAATATAKGVGYGGADMGPGFPGYSPSWYMKQKQVNSPQTSLINAPSNAQ